MARRWVRSEEKPETTEEPGMPGRGQGGWRRLSDGESGRAGTNDVEDRGRVPVFLQVGQVRTDAMPMGLHVFGAQQKLAIFQEQEPGLCDHPTAHMGKKPPFSLLDHVSADNQYGVGSLFQIASLWAKTRKLCQLLEKTNCT